MPEDFTRTCIGITQHDKRAAEDACERSLRV